MGLRPIQEGLKEGDSFEKMPFGDAIQKLSYEEVKASLKRLKQYY